MPCFLKFWSSFTFRVQSPRNHSALVAGKRIGVARIMRCVVNSFDMREADETDDEQAENDRCQRLGNAAAFRCYSGIGGILIDGRHGEPLPARQRHCERASVQSRRRTASIQFTTGNARLTQAQSPAPVILLLRTPRRHKHFREGRSPGSRVKT